MGKIELRPDDKGNFDELFAENASIHIEMMSDKTAWLCVEVGKERLALWISSKRALEVFTEDQSEIIPT